MVTKQLTEVYVRGSSRDRIWGNILVFEEGTENKSRDACRG
jgi:hypothetical protein